MPRKYSILTAQKFQTLATFGCTPSNIDELVMTSPSHVIEEQHEDSTTFVERSR